jgi:hypothetical protein
MVKPITTEDIKPMIDHHGGRKRIAFLTGGTTRFGTPTIVRRKPQQRNWNGVSVWCVQYSGLAALVDPVEINGRLVPQIAYSL